jgi:histidinol-phosphate aminotransferase
MSSIEEFIVPWVKEAAPYSDKHMDYAWSHPEILRMMSNENPLPPPESVIKAVLNASKIGNYYPGSGEQLRKKLGENAGLDAEHVLLGNGSTDIIDIVVNTFIAPGDEAIIHSPTFSMYEARIKIHGGTPIDIPLSPPPIFYWDIERMFQAVSKKTKLIFICTPNNPTGNQIEETDLRQLLDLGIPTFIDEAYYELEDEPFTMAYLVNDYHHAMINRTMSKAFGLAGFRLGYIIANPQLISFFNRVRIPWNVSLQSIAAALAALDDTEDQIKKRENCLRGRQYLHDEINKIPGLIAFPSEGNFILIDARSLGKTSVQIRDDFIARGIFIRPMSPHNMQEGFIRVTVGTDEQNQYLIEVLRSYTLMHEQATGETNPS